MHYLARGLVCMIILFPFGIPLQLASFFKPNFLQLDPVLEENPKSTLSRCFNNGGDSSSPSNKDLRLNCGKFLRICGILLGVGIGETL